MTITLIISWYSMRQSPPARAISIKPDDTGSSAVRGSYSGPSHMVTLAGTVVSAGIDSTPISTSFSRYPLGSGSTEVSESPPLLNKTHPTEDGDPLIPETLLTRHWTPSVSLPTATEMPGHNYSRRRWREKYFSRSTYSIGIPFKVNQDTASI